MEAKLKQRIVGVAVLVSAALIILAFLLYHSDKKEQTTLNVPLSQSSQASSPQTAQTSKITVQPQASPAVKIAQTQAAQNVPAAISSTESSQPKISAAASKLLPSASTKKTASNMGPAAEMHSVKAKPSVPHQLTAPKIKKPHLSVKKQSKPGHKATAAKVWSVQLASFENKKNAAHLIHLLRKKGFAAYAKPFKAKKGWMTRVFVGPETHKNQAEKLLVKLDKLIHIKGLVVEYQI